MLTTDNITPMSLLSTHAHTPLCAHAAVEAKGSMSCVPVQILNLEVKDNHEEATLGAFLILQICDMVSPLKDTCN